MSQQKTDNAQWFAEEVQPYEALLREYLRQRFPTLGDVDDVVQESYLKLLRKKTEGEVRSARGMLFTVARNVALDLFRRRRRAPFVADGAGVAAIVPVECPGIAEVACRDQELALLAEALEALPDRCRQVLRLRKIFGHTHREIAAALGLSERMVNYEIGNGVRRCAAYLQARGLTMGAGEERR